MTTPSIVRHNAWFPGRIIGGGALVLGPIVWTVGQLLRQLPPRTGPRDLPFAAPRELAAFHADPGWVMAGYAIFLAGSVLMWPAIATLARIVAARCSRLAFWGGSLLIFSLFARSFFAGVDQAGFQLTRTDGLERATAIVLGSYVDLSYGHGRVPVTLSAGAIVGGILLALGLFRSGTFGPARCLVIVAWGWTWHGVLKEAKVVDLVVAALLAATLIPVGIRVLRDRVPELVVSTEKVAPVPLNALRW